MQDTKRILVIEDEKPLGEAFVFLLTHEGFSVKLAENGRVGLDMLHAFKPHLILLDMLMPVMNGLQFLQAAQLPTAYPQVKTLLLSNLSDAISIDNAHLYGVTKSILKADLSPAELASAVKKMLTSEEE